MNLRIRPAGDDARMLPETGSRSALRLALANAHLAGITLAELRLAAKVNMVVQEIWPTTA